MGEFDQRETVDPSNRPFAHRLAAMVDAGLVTWREYGPWTEAVIGASDHPIFWAVDVTTTKHTEKAVGTSATR